MTNYSALQGGRGFRRVFGDVRRYPYAKSAGIRYRHLRRHPRAPHVHAGWASERRTGKMDRDRVPPLSAGEARRQWKGPELQLLKKNVASAPYG